MKSGTPHLLFARENGKVYPFPGLEAAGMKAGKFFRLDPAGFLKLPDFSELFRLPGRLPVGFDADGKPSALAFDPYSPKKEKIYAVAAFIPPGHAVTHSVSYEEEAGAPPLPLFSYAACVFYNDAFYAAAVPVDADARHDERRMDPAGVERGVGAFKRRFPSNRLVPHLAHCATVSGCANAKNFFLGRFEAPVPTSPVCNAQCQGCISFQPADRGFPSNQNRIQFVPAPEEIAELALYHIGSVDDPIVSFGQGCEGEPTLSGDTIEKAIRLIRAKTLKGSINMNTNASRPKVIERLFAAGLNSIRVSLNSVREPYYSLYYQPRGYGLADLVASIRAAKNGGGFVSLNYLSMPGFTDSEDEAAALERFIADHGVDMIQWRNLNYDPLQYFRDLGLAGADLRPIGMEELMRRLSRRFPRLRMGYFNPKKEAIEAALAGRA